MQHRGCGLSWLFLVAFELVNVVIAQVRLSFPVYHILVFLTSIATSMRVMLLELIPQVLHLLQREVRSFFKGSGKHFKAIQAMDRSRHDTRTLLERGAAL